MPREDTSMSVAELRDFMGGIVWVALGILDADGKPRADLVAAVVRDDRLFFTAATGSITEACLSADPRCCCTADVFPTYYEIKGVTIHGRAQRIDPDPVVLGALEERAGMHGLGLGLFYALPLLDDAFGFDFDKLARR